MDPRLVTQKEVSDNCEVNATSIEECMSFLSVTIKSNLVIQGRKGGEYQKGEAKTR